MYLSKSTEDLDHWNLRRSVSFFLIIDKIMSYVPLIVLEYNDQVLPLKCLSRLGEGFIPS